MIQIIQVLYRNIEMIKAIYAHTQTYASFDLLKQYSQLYC